MMPKMPIEKEIFSYYLYLRSLQFLLTLERKYLLKIFWNLCFLLILNIRIVQAD